MNALLLAKAGSFAQKHWWKFAIAGALTLILLLAYCSGRKDGATSEVLEQQERTIELQQDTAAAASTAADERLEDTVKIAEQKKELDDALKVENDPATRRIRRGCSIMRQQQPRAALPPACARY